MERDFDVICLGRAAVDLYGEQIGSRLEDMISFRKYLGGSSGNIAVGIAKLGLRSSMLTRQIDLNESPLRAVLTRWRRDPSLRLESISEKPEQFGQTWSGHDPPRAQSRG